MSDDIRSLLPESVQPIVVSSGYGANTKEPFVKIEVKGVSTQMTPENARDVALSLLEAAATAYTDGFLVEFVKERMDGDDHAAAALLIEFRKWRDEGGII